MHQLCCKGHVDHTPGDAGINGNTWCFTWWHFQAIAMLTLNQRIVAIPSQIIDVLGVITQKVSQPESCTRCNLQSQDISRTLMEIL